MELVAFHDLLLADLTGPGLHRIGTSRGRLLDGGPRSYRQTALWAKAVHACGQKPSTPHPPAFTACCGCPA